MSTSRPILFSAPMVRAILDGTKTQTRRVCKGEPLVINDEPLTTPSGIPYDAIRPGVIRCPYGAPGDSLWVKETWALVPATAYRASDVAQTVNPDDSYYAAVHKEGWPLSPPSRWRSPRFMPRWASRLTLRITEVRVERLQDISEDDAWAEGVREDEVLSLPMSPGAAAAAYSALWDSINGKAHPWESNCWVWVLSFEVMR